ncbi:hypothetical protein Tco_0566685 [Tanacetum coccineum]
MIGRGRDTKTTEAARHTGVKGLGEDKKGSQRRIRNIIRKEMVKEIGEMISVLWAMTKGKSKEEASRWVGSDGSKDVVCAKHQYLSSSLEAMGNERFIAVKGEWKGKVEEIFLVCIYGSHISQQKASLWDRLAGLMDTMKRGAKEKIELYKNEAMRWELEVENRTLSDNERLISLEARKMWEKKKNEFSNMLR